jgi:hypothetical protein
VNPNGKGGELSIGAKTQRIKDIRARSQVRASSRVHSKQQHLSEGGQNVVEPFVNEYVTKYGGNKHLLGEEDDSSSKIVVNKKGVSD